MANANVNQNTKERKSDVIVVTAAAAASEGDLIIFGPWVGVALHDALINTPLSLYVGGDKEYDAYSTVAVAATVGSSIYYNPTTGVFAASGGAGLYLIGYTTVIKNSDNVFRFEKLRSHVLPTDTTITLSDITDLASLTVTMSQVSDIGDLAFADLADVDVAGVTNNDTLKYDSATSKWIDVAVTD
jgi:predicted RecA/RadA family phage recombinase